MSLRTVEYPLVAIHIPDEELSVRSITLSCLTLALAVSSLQLVTAPLPAQETKTLWVAHHRVDCIGVGPQKCYLIKETQYEDWRFWYGEIEGFDYEDGYAYEITVVEETIDNPPADAGTLQLKLVEVLLKVDTFETPSPEEPPAAPVAPPIVEPEPATEQLPTESNAPPQAEPELVPAPIPAPTPESVPEPAPIAPIAAPRPIPLGPVHRGHLTIGAGVEARSFKLCGAEESIWVEDRTDADLWGLYRRLASYPNRPVFMEVTGELAGAPAGGFGAHFAQQILIRDVRNASVESAGCFAKPDKFAFRAAGNEPFWSVEISKQGLAFAEMGQDDRILFPYSPPTFFGEQIIYRSQIGSHEPRSIVVRLDRESCSDSMADATSSFTATVTIDNRTLSGCARAGEEEP
jgi:uncharacterized membrane protein